MTTGDEVLTLSEAASYLKINEQTARRLAREGQIPAFKVGGSWRSKKSLLDRWAEGQSTARQPRLILAVDDEQAVLDYVRDVLASAGFRVLTANCGPDAIDLVRRECPDLVLLDLKMPGMDGPATLGHIRQVRGSVPVVVLTAFPDSELMERALEHGPITLLAKPLSPHLLVDAVRKAVVSSS